MLVAAVALVAGSVAAAAVIATRGGGTHHPPAAKPLGGSPPLVLELPGPTVKGSNAAIYAAARKRLPAGDVRLAVARAILAYDPARRDAHRGGAPAAAPAEPGRHVRARDGAALGRRSAGGRAGR